MRYANAIGSIAMGTPCLFMNNGVGRNSEESEIDFLCRYHLAYGEVLVLWTAEEGYVFADTIPG